MDGLTFCLQTFLLQYTNFLSPTNKESVILSAVIPVHALWKQEEIRTVSVLARLRRLLNP